MEEFYEKDLKMVKMSIRYLRIYICTVYLVTKKTIDSYYLSPDPSSVRKRQQACVMQSKIKNRTSSCNKARSAFLHEFVLQSSNNTYLF